MSKKSKKKLSHYEKALLFEPYVREIADLMKLKDWEITFSEDAADEGKAASVRSVYGRKQAILYIGINFFDEAPKEQRHTVCHELIHLHFFPMYTPTYEVLYSDAKEFYLHAFEYGVDGMADAMAPFLPLPTVQL